MALGGEVVHLVRPDQAEGADEAVLVDEVAVVQDQPVADVVDAPGIEGAAAPDEAVDLVWDKAGMFPELKAPALYRSMQFKPLEDFEYLGLVSEVAGDVRGRSSLPESAVDQFVRCRTSRSPRWALRRSSETAQPNPACSSWRISSACCQSRCHSLAKRSSMNQNDCARSIDSRMGVPLASLGINVWSCGSKGVGLACMGRV